MLALSLGLCAALAWGIHDICVRQVAQGSAVLPLLIVMLMTGTLLLLPLALVFGDWHEMNAIDGGLSVLSGLIYICACIGLYKAFGIGPVALVAPIVGAYPILSVGWAAASGQIVPVDQWIAVVVVLCGVALVSILSDEQAGNGSRVSAVGWAVLAAVGFAGTFATGQAATASGDELPVIFISRLTASVVCLTLLMLARSPKRPDRSAWPYLVLMALLDTTAHGIVLASGTLQRAEFAAVGASIFGVATIILARLILREPMRTAQWVGVAITFSGIGYLAL
ncbi:DMT family transporter [Roseovarius pelagicus]|uniref:DMT family transporter n=1 Tax=Roseovarius pelagicus TaxID=2980108 RepID=A0ABY6D889_9RHOB|nr:DMT family transporter [Roseovarius pelagicus]UXX82313.1 DMT family transporter [Roseovarius pelagicus]